MVVKSKQLSESKQSKKQVSAEYYNWEWEEFQTKKPHVGRKAPSFTQLIATSPLKQLIRSRFVQAVTASFPQVIKQSLTQYHRLSEKQISLTGQL